MANESAASDTAVSLIAAACVVAPRAPDDPTKRQAWLQTVGDLAESLYRQAQNLDGAIAQLADCVPIMGVILRVEEVKGKGLITMRPTMGNHSDDPSATEDIRTPWLSEPKGAALFAQAQALVGQACRFGKYMEAGQGGKKFRMVAWIDPLASSASGSETRDEGGETGSDPDDEPSLSEIRRDAYGVSPRSGAPQPAPSPQPAPQTSDLDLAQLRNLPMRNLDDLMMNAFQHFGVDGDTVHRISMEACGAAGPRNGAQYAKTWNQLVTRYYREAA